MSSLYLDSSGKARTAFWSEELEKAGNKRMRIAWGSAAAQSKTLTTLSASRMGYITHLNMTRAYSELASISKPGLLAPAQAARPVVSTGGSRALGFFKHASAYRWLRHWPTSFKLWLLSSLSPAAAGLGNKRLLLAPHPLAP